MPTLDLEAVIVETIYAEMVLSAQASGMPQKFIDGIVLRKISETKFEIENMWKENGKPLAKWFEHGTKDHWIEPRDPDGVLAWPKLPEGQQRNASAIYYKSNTPADGEMIFSKGHYVSGLPAMESMHIGFRIGKERMAGVLKSA